MVFDAIVLAGGRATRMGGIVKPLLRVAGVTLLDTAIAATAGAGTLVVVGPVDLPVPQRVQLVREDPPFGGPAAALAAGLKLLRRGNPAPWVLVLAADQPEVGIAVPMLLVAADTGVSTDAVIGIDRAGRRQLLMALYRSVALTTAVRIAEQSAAGVTGLPMHRLIAELSTVEIMLPDATAPNTTTGDATQGDAKPVDVDTWEDAARWGADLD
ncbi:MAG: molybdenum cofactor guanylyltransferase [Nakamurella sp.]